MTYGSIRYNLLIHDIPGCKSICSSTLTFTALLLFYNISALAQEPALQQQTGTKIKVAQLITAPSAERHLGQPTHRQESHNRTVTDTKKAVIPDLPMNIVSPGQKVVINIPPLLINNQYKELDTSWKPENSRLIMRSDGSHTFTWQTFSTESGVYTIDFFIKEDPEHLVWVPATASVVIEGSYTDNTPAAADYSATQNQPEPNILPQSTNYAADTPTPLQPGQDPEYQPNTGTANDASGVDPVYAETIDGIDPEDADPSSFRRKRN